MNKNLKKNKKLQITDNIKKYLKFFMLFRKILEY